MKNMIEYMTTMIITIILVFVFTSIISIGTQMLNARFIHTSAVEKLQSSYYSFDPNSLLNSEEYKEWAFEIKEENSINTRKDYLVSLNYKINLPLFSSKIDANINGYAR